MPSHVHKMEHKMREMVEETKEKNDFQRQQNTPFDFDRDTVRVGYRYRILKKAGNGLKT